MVIGQERGCLRHNYVVTVALLAVLLMLVSFVGGAAVVSKRNEQAKRDRQRQTYRLSFPSDVQPDQVTAYFNTLSGLLRPKPSWLGELLGLQEFEQSFQPKPSIVLETWRVGASNLAWYVKIPYSYVSPVRMQLESLVPGIQLTHEKKPPSIEPVYARELKLHYGHRPLRIDEPVFTNASLRSAFGDVIEDEVLALQIIFSPMRGRPQLEYTQKPSTAERSFSSYASDGQATRGEVKDRNTKASEANFLATVRVAATAETSVRASYMVRHVTAVFDSTDNHPTYFQTKLHLFRQRFYDQINRALTPGLPGVQLTASELACFTGWPLGDMTTPGQPAAPSRRLQVPNTVLHAGIELGASNYGSQSRPVAVGFKEALVHQHIIAPPGKGKTVLLANEFKQIVDAGFGAVVIEQTGDLIKRVLDYVPADRIEDVIYLDATDDKFPVGFNVLTEGDAATVIDGIGAIFESMYPDHPSLWAKRALYNGLHTLHQAGNATVTDLLALVSPTSDERGWSRLVRDKATDAQIVRYWQEMENDSKQREQEKMAPLHNRFWPVERSSLINILGQSESAFTMREVVTENKILIVNLAGVDSDAAKIMGAMLVMALWHQVKANPMPASPNYLIMDEAHHFMNLPIDLGMMLVEARKWGLGLFFAHQALYQLPPTMKQAVQQNMQTKVVFQTLADDARDMARVIGDPITEYDVAHLGQYEAIARIATPSGISSPVTIDTAAPAPGYGNAHKVIYASRRRYGTPIAKVKTEILARRSVSEKQATRKPSQASGWGAL